MTWRRRDGGGRGGNEDFYFSSSSKRKKKANKRWNNCKCYFLARHPLISHLNYTRGRNGRGRNGPLQQLPSRIGPRRGRDGHLCLIVRLPPPPLPTSVAHNQQQAEQRPSDLDWVRMVGGGGGGGGGGRRRADYFIQQQNNDREWGEEGGLRRWGVSLFSSSHYFSSVF